MIFNLPLKVLLIHGDKAGSFASIKDLDAEKRTAQLTDISSSLETPEAKECAAIELPFTHIKIIDPTDKYLSKSLII